MSIANVIKSRLARKKKRKIFEDYASGKEGPMEGLPVEEHAKDWDNRHTKEFTEKYRKPAEGKPPLKPSKPMEPDKPVEENPNYQTQLKKEDQRNRKIKKTRKKKVVKPKSEFLEKYYGKDWA